MTGWFRRTGREVSERMESGLLGTLARDYGKTAVICTRDPAGGVRGNRICRMRDGLIAGDGQTPSPLT